MKKRIKDLLKEKADKGRVSCAVARKIAEELRVSYRAVGETANKLKIKITSCELGCF